MHSFAFRAWGIFGVLFFTMVLATAQVSWRKPDVPEDHEYFAGKWIPVSKVVNSDTLQARLNFGWPIFNHAGAGMYFIPEYARLYQAFLRMPLGKKDFRIMDAEGGLTYFPEEKVFRIGPKDCLLGDSKRGNVVTYSPETGQLSAAGMFNLPLRFGKTGPEIETAGSWSQLDGPVNIETQLVHGLDLPQIPNKAWELLGPELAKRSLTHEMAELDDPTTYFALAQLMDEGQKDQSRSERFTEEIEHAEVPGHVELNRKYVHDLVLGKVNWKFDNDHRTLWTDQPVEVLTLGGHNVYRVFEARIEYQFSNPGESGVFPSDTLSIFLGNDDCWVYFRCYDSRVETCSMSWAGDAGKKDYNRFLGGKGTKKEGSGPICAWVSEAEKDVFVERFSTRY